VQWAASKTVLIQQLLDSPGGPRIEHITGAESCLAQRKHQRSAEVGLTQSLEKCRWGEKLNALAHVDKLALLLLGIGRLGVADTVEKVATPEGQKILSVRKVSSVAKMFGPEGGNTGGTVILANRQVVCQILVKTVQRTAYEVAIHD
jgi:hypothetical protein